MIRGCPPLMDDWMADSKMDLVDMSIFPETRSTAVPSTTSVLTCNVDSSDGVSFVRDGTVTVIALLGNSRMTLRAQQKSLLRPAVGRRHHIFKQRILQS
jgi:hypothetical protein